MHGAAEIPPAHHFGIQPAGSCIMVPMRTVKSKMHHFIPLIFLVPWILYLPFFLLSFST